MIEQVERFIYRLAASLAPAESLHGFTDEFQVAIVVFAAATNEQMEFQAESFGPGQLTVLCLGHELSRLLTFQHCCQPLT
jgi:hypothetical protein